MKKKYIFLGITVVVVLILVGIFGGGTTGNVVSGESSVEIYKSPSCGCCLEHSAYLDSNGFDPRINLVSDMHEIKERYHIPRNMESCHTAIMDGYFVEGHMPMEAIDKLLSERPDIDGIALPNMPAGSPGMPGIKNREWVIYAIKDGKASEFMRI